MIREWSLLNSEPDFRFLYRYYCNFTVSWRWWWEQTVGRRSNCLFSQTCGPSLKSNISAIHTGANQSQPTSPATCLNILAFIAVYRAWALDQLTSEARRHLYTCLRIFKRYRNGHLSSRIICSVRKVGVILTKWFTTVSKLLKHHRWGLLWKSRAV